MSVQTISKARLAGLISQLCKDKLSGAAIIQTSTQRTVVLRYSAGKLVRVNAGGNSVDNALAILQQSDEYRFSFSPMSIDAGPELIALAEFIEHLGIEGDSIDDTDVSAVLEAEPAQSSATNGAGKSADPGRDLLRSLLIQLAAGEIGPMATMIVDQAIDSGEPVDQIIARVAGQIPDKQAADRFTRQAREGSKESS